MGIEESRTGNQEGDKKVSGERLGGGGARLLLPKKWTERGDRVQKEEKRERKMPDGFKTAFGSSTLDHLVGKGQTRGEYRDTDVVGPVKGGATG